MFCQIIYIQFFIKKRQLQCNYFLQLLMQNLDLTQHQLIHDGLLIMKKSPTTQLHGLLFEDIMVLLQKQDDRYVLKVLPNPGAGGSENKSKESVFYPIIKVNLILVRQSAVDKTTFFLINTSLSQMLELTTPSSSECKGWVYLEISFMPWNSSPCLVIQSWGYLKSIYGWSERVSLVKFINKIVCDFANGKVLFIDLPSVEQI